MPVIKGKPIKGEIEGSPIRFFHSGKIIDSQGDELEYRYSVEGFVIDKANNTSFSFNKQFDNLKSARSYFDNMIKTYPYSEVIIKELAERQLLYYA